MTIEQYNLVDLQLAKEMLRILKKMNGYDGNIHDLIINMTSEVRQIIHILENINEELRSRT